MKNERVVPMPGQEPDENHCNGEEEFKQVLDEVEPEPGGAEQDDMLTFRRDAPLDDPIRGVVTHSRHRRRSKQNLMAKRDARKTDTAENQAHTEPEHTRGNRETSTSMTTQNASDCIFSHLHQLQHTQGAAR